MLIKRVEIENVRSFLDRAELILDGSVVIVIGSNGGGKTNLIDTIVIILRRYLFASMYAAHVPTPELQNRYEFRPNDALNNMVLEKYSNGEPNRDQIVEMEIEVTQIDINNMHTMKASDTFYPSLNPSS
jgi:putative ATP-dependent endonuclease of the OLD family